jgi:hypothetical protein
MAETLPFWDRYRTDPDFAEAVDEEARSIAESVAWNTRMGQPAQPCPACGRLVSRVLESAVTDGTGWQASHWEPGYPAAVRHTGRRCTWLSAHPDLPRTA